MIITVHFYRITFFSLSDKMSRQLGARKTRNYSPLLKLENAVKMVESGAMSRKKAAATFGVPRTTLIDKLSGRYCLGACPGCKTVLTKSNKSIPIYV